MRVQGNELYASDGYVLFRRMTGENMGEMVYMGAKDVPLDFGEAKVVEVDGLNYMITEDMTYDELTTALIRLKYTLDEELALMANLREDAEGHKDEEATFQEWRTKCKEAAREALDKKEKYTFAVS